MPQIGEGSLNSLLAWIEDQARDACAVDASDALSATLRVEPVRGNALGLFVGAPDSRSRAEVDVRDVSVDATGSIVEATLLVFAVSPRRGFVAPRRRHVWGGGVIAAPEGWTVPFIEHTPEADDEVARPTLGEAVADVILSRHS